MNANDLTNAALLDIENEAEAARKALAEAAGDIARFALLGDVLHEHGLDFHAGLIPHACGVAYRITMRGPQARRAGEMMLTLAALECEESPYQDGLDADTTRITGPHAPDFYLRIERQAGATVSNPGESCHAGPGMSVQNGVAA